jgi:hypothetical protein
MPGSIITVRVGVADTSHVFTNTFAASMLHLNVVILVAPMLTRLTYSDLCIVLSGYGILLTPSARKLQDEHLLSKHACFSPSAATTVRGARRLPDIRRLRYMRTTYISIL